MVGQMKISREWISVLDFVIGKKISEQHFLS